MIQSDLRLLQMEEMVVQENQYDPFGQNLPGIETEGTPDCKDQYTGQERIGETGLE